MLVRMAIIKKVQTNPGEGLEGEELPTLLVGR